MIRSYASGPVKQTPDGCPASSLVEAGEDPLVGIAEEVLLDRAEAVGPRGAAELVRALARLPPNLRVVRVALHLVDCLHELLHARRERARVFGADAREEAFDLRRRRGGRVAEPAADDLVDLV